MVDEQISLLFGLKEGEAVDLARIKCVLEQVGNAIRHEQR